MAVTKVCNVQQSFGIHGHPNIDWFTIHLLYGCLCVFS
jgi:hypothetical protein